MTVLVTGAAGFVGLNIVKRLAEGGERVVALARRPADADTERFLRSARERVTWALGDVRDRDGMADLARREGVNAIIHAATITAPLAVEKADPASIIDVNLGGTLNMLEAARGAGARRFVFISSTGVYGAPDDPTLPIREDQPLKITSLYTVSKQAGEALCRRYTALFDLSAVSGRLGNAYGPMERATLSRTNMSVVHALGHAAVRGEPARVYGAARYRDFCYSDDVAEAFARLALADRLTWDVYNVAGERAAPMREALDALTELAPGFTWSEASEDQADVLTLPASERGTLDMTRLAEDCGFTPRYDLRAGLAAYLAWLRAEAQGGGA